MAPGIMVIRCYAARRSPLAGRTPTRTLRLAGRILNAMNCRIDGDEGTVNDTTNGADAGNSANKISSASRTREAIDELIDHNDERSPEQKQQYMLMAAFVARLCVAGSGGGGGGDSGGKKSKGKSGSALSWPSAGGRGFPGLVDAVFAVLGKVSCNVSPVKNVLRHSLPQFVVVCRRACHIRRYTHHWQWTLKVWK